MLTALLALALVQDAPVTGTLNGETLTQDLDYRVEGCVEPEAVDAKRLRTVEEYNAAVDAHSDYAAAMQTYLNCVEAQVHADYERLAEALNATLQGELSVAQTKIDASADSLEERRERFLADSGASN